MATIIDYGLVVERMQALGMHSLYFNSGAFGPIDREQAKAVGWIGPEDPSIRAEARDLLRQVREPYVESLTELALRAWHELLAGPIWVMPKSHWAYELDFGNSAWMPEALQRVDVDPAQLKARTNASAIEFALRESNGLAQFLRDLLTHLAGSDFSLAFPSHPVIATLHHHKQIWWMSTDAAIISELEELVPDESRQ